MEREKLLRYRGLAPIRFLNDFNAGLLTAEEYKLIREVNKNNAWDELDSYVEHIGQAGQPEEQPVAASVAKQEAAPQIISQRFELRDDVRIEKNFYVVPNDVIDVLAPLQTPAEEVVYRRLIRMSYGWRRNYCRASIPHLLKTSQIKSENTVRKALRGLIEKGHIAEYVNERGRVDINNDGTLYIVFLPHDIPGLPLDRASSERGSFFESPSINEGMEESDGDSINDTPIKNWTPSKSEGAKYEGGANFRGAKFEAPPPQKVRVQNLNP